MLCRRSASLTSSTRMSLEMASRSLRKFSACSAFLVTRSSFLILVRPSTSEPISAPNSASISLRVAAVSSIVSCSSAVAIVASSSRISARMRGDFERMGEIGGAGGALLIAMRLHGIDIGAVEQRLVGVGLVALHALDQLVLTRHGAALLRAARRRRRKPVLRSGQRRSARAGSRIGAIRRRLARHPAQQLLLGHLVDRTVGRLIVLA